MENSDKEIQRMKTALEEDHGREFTLEEAAQAVSDLKSFAHILFEIAQKEMSRKDKLEENPKGYHLDDEGTCLICGSHCVGENTWFDKHGLKCMICQRAINSKIIPVRVALNREMWYSKFDLELYFNIGGSDLTRYIKQNILKARIIQNEKGKAHFHLFLLKDNKDVLPPKKLLKSRTVKIMRNGEEYFTAYCKSCEGIQNLSATE